MPRSNRDGVNIVAVRLRLKRIGRNHRSFFRLCAMDSRSPRNGRVIEELGWLDPKAGDGNENEKSSLKRERIEYWLSVGAQPTETVRSLFERNGINVK